MTRRATLQLFALISLVATIGYALEPGDPDQSILPPSDPNVQTTPVADRQGADPGQLDGADGKGLRLREGMNLVNQVGELREAGGRIAFYPEGDKRSLQVLENLALERVSRELDQSNRKWSVSGIVTEYKGGNYLLLHRAVLKARVSSAPGPRS
ncbi:MAG: hypothetical protein O3C40_29085 [Planctomycetota bacterium]|nr:hypothetical protein [Planctomycetota bacterium]